MTTIIQKASALALLCTSVLGLLPLQAQMVTVNPPESTVAFENPLKGFRGSLNTWYYSPKDYETTAHNYIRWNEVENDESDTVQKIKDVCNAKWSNLPDLNVKVIPRIYLDYNPESGDECWPADIPNGDWTSQKFKDRVVRLIGRLGEAWDNDPRVAWVQTGIMGLWGEQESPVGIDAEWEKRMGDAFAAAFKNKMTTVRNMDAWPHYEMGCYWDSFAHPYQPGVANAIKSLNNQGRYLTRPIGGEVGYNWGNETTDTLYGAGPTQTMENDSYSNYMIDAIRRLHTTSLGWISGYGEGSSPSVVRANAARMQQAFGYNFHLSEFSCSAKTNPGSNMDIRFKVKNTGSAPFYENWPVAVVLIDESTRKIVWKATLPNVDARTWHPGDHYNNATRSYQTPAIEHQISASIPLSVSLNEGQYLVGLSILEPNSRKPGVFFTIPNFFKQSQSQPLCRMAVGEGVALSDPNLTGVTFDHLKDDDRRSYATTQQGGTHTLIAQSSSQGVISRNTGSRTYLKDTGVQVTAKGNLGFAFSSWGGALAGSTKNPAIIVMDADKTVSANYVSVPTYTLTANAANGSIILNPAGGVYNQDTVVTVTCEPNSGYAFTSWSGNLAGTSRSMTITMNSNKTVTAGIVADPSGGATQYRVDCGSGSNYIMPDGIAYIADTTPGNNSTRWNEIRNTDDDGLYQSEHWGPSFAYDIPLANGDYEVTLMFAETYFNYAGARRFNVSMEGNPIINNLDVFARVGQNAAHNETRTVTLTDGVLNLQFDRIVDNAIVSAIKVSKASPISYTVQSSASNGRILLNPPGGTYLEGASVTLTAKPDSGYAFASWAGDVTGTSASKTIKIDRNLNISANFGFVLNTTASNGTVTFDPPGPVYQDGTVVTATATPNTGYAFRSWSGGIFGSANPATITMDSSKNLVAHFEANSQYLYKSGPSHTTGDGSVFSDDTGISTGGSIYNVTAPISNTTDDELYQYERWGSSFGYNIPLANGRYEVTLMFAEIYYNWAGARVFNASIEGNQVIQNLDIWSKVGMNAAYNEAHVVQVNDGQMNVAFSNVVDNAKVSAIKVRSLPSTVYTVQTSASNGSVTLDPPGGVYSPGTQVKLTATADSKYAFTSWGGSLSGLPNPTTISINSDMNVTANFIPVTQFRVNAGGGSFTAGDGSVYLEDTMAAGGGASGTTASINNTTDDAIYQSERYGTSFGYNIPLQDGYYAVTLMFAEIYYNSGGSRIFNVTLEGNQVINNLDIWSKVGMNAAYDETHTVLVEDGLLNIGFNRIADNATCAGIKVVSLPAPSYTLQTNSTNGSIDLDPSGGVYPQGSVVKVTANANANYSFGSWSGNLTGSVNPRFITMNGDKNVTANFASIGKNVLFLVADANTLGAGDSSILTRLLELGHNVQVVSDELSATTHANGKALVLISSTVASSNIGTKFRDVAVPVINWETALQDEFRFTAATTSTNQGNGIWQTMLNIVNPGHPLAGGLASGGRTVTTTSDAAGFSWGEPGGSPIIIARMNDGSNHPSIYAYETGGAMVGGTAPARRVHLFLQGDTFANLSADGIKLFDAACNWAMSLPQSLNSSPPQNDYAIWASNMGLMGAASGDDDNDGQTNFAEYAFGQDPLADGATNPIVVPLSPVTGTFSYSRRVSAPLTYTIWYSTNLASESWHEDTGAILGEATPVDGTIEIVPVTVSPALLTHPQLFIQVRANNGAIQ